MNVVDALNADAGTLCVVGAGGKKTTLYALANRLERAVVTATVRIPIFDHHVDAVRVTDDPRGALADATYPLGLVPAREREDRYRGYDTETVAAIAEAHDGPVLVKADGARMREFKAPNEREPQLPAVADVVVPIASTHAVGRPLTDEVVHRPERVAACTDLELGDRITPAAVGQVLASTDGGLKAVPENATAIPLLNKVDDGEDEAVAREIAATIHEHADVPRVVLARMHDASVVDVI
ncbi:selenium cofactor biosynthesis protein YqeC [Natronobeatus ordinarius]|uniref:selenium cofactor biosynthesis protein YqeC n=1 Tax=Natronobeatus ordinarius TaxID=2963433 RepID=UPI0020CD9695|nr:selenium cofactor biosynthesis protein YqeC [Natronobeatus ordinarius]